MKKKKINFAPGPAALPTEVLQRIRKNAFNWEGTGYSIMEISHRSIEYLELHKQLQTRLRRLLNIPKSHKILLLPGGARAQFSAVPLNLCKHPQTSQAIYIVSGYWSAMAANMAQVKVLPMEYDIGIDNKMPRLAAISKSKKPTSKNSKSKTTWLPADAMLKKYQGKVSYTHCCLNETIDGVRLPKLPPNSNIPLVADISSCIAAYPLDFAGLDLAYACAQKNLGIAGLTVVSINSKLLKLEASPNLPHILSYQRQAVADSLLNTPTTVAVYVCNLMCEWLEEQGGVANLTEINQRKAMALYEQIDMSDGFYINKIQPEFRSLTNVVFDMANTREENKFIEEATAQGLMNLRGHSAGAGAIRASIYNAISERDVMRLCDFMHKYKRKHKA